MENLRQDLDMLRLKSKRIFREGTRLNATLEFEILDLGKTMELLSFEKTKEGQIQYKTHSVESVVASNGEISQKENETLVQWKKKSSVLTLSLKADPINSAIPNTGKQVSVEKYWNGK